MMVAVLALASCGEGKVADAGNKPAAPAQAQQVQEAATPQWDVLVGSDLPQAVSDMTGWLIEHGIISSVVMQDGKQLILVGPFNSQAEAEAKKAELEEKLAKAKKRNVNATVIEHRATQ
ncbi:penicillin-binding protein activator LpoB [Pseudomonas sp. MF4836]|uniref:penicillin-binding protein activator LpoB n=1 Tax=Pseudomonas sp. MF4836 TaxID=1960827 RepID=UPI000995EE18|nr:penicillin-binding protein activator LpoB [Pseudomonas sp. MF4836]OOV89307.1 penicillin-binding protein activator LpoB [Pseudomonas sp. MF4836]